MKQEILEVFEQFRMPPTVDDQYDTVGKPILSSKLDQFINAGDPIDFVMLGYPMKSPNDRDKVIGKLPDLAEEVSINNFATFADKVKKIYNPGVNITLVSDGFVFSDVMQVQDKVVEQYEEVMLDMISNKPITWYDMKDFYSRKLSANTVRERISTQFGVTEAELERRILTDTDVRYLYQGMIKFLEVDLAINPYSSNNQLHKAAKRTAREMMFRNEAYSHLIQAEFKDSIRLSMHRTINNGKKFSFQLIPSPRAWTSPWHCALLIDEDNVYATVHRKDAEAAGYQLVSKDGRPYYFTA